MSEKHKILMMGASYGSLRGMKLALAGHDVTLIYLPEEADLINAAGARVRLPVRGLDAPVELDSRDAPGTLRAAGTGDVDPADYDLVGLAMQGTAIPFARRARTARCRCALGQAQHVDHEHAAASLSAPHPQARCRGAGRLLHRCKCLGQFRSGALHLRSPDPQAFRPPDEPVNVLLAGNYRCVQPNGARSIRDAVHSDLEQSRAVYDWVGEVCRSVGAAPKTRCRSRNTSPPRRAAQRRGRYNGCDIRRSAGPQPRRLKPQASTPSRIHACRVRIECSECTPHVGSMTSGPGL